MPALLLVLAVSKIILASSPSTREEITLSVSLEEMALLIASFTRASSLALLSSEVVFFDLLFLDPLGRPAAFAILVIILVAPAIYGSTQLINRQIFVIDASKMNGPAAPPCRLPAVSALLANQTNGHIITKS